MVFFGGRGGSVLGNNFPLLVQSYYINNMEVFYHECVYSRYRETWEDDLYQGESLKFGI